MGVRLKEREEMKLTRYGVYGMHTLTYSTRVRCGLGIVMLGLRIGSWLAGFKAEVQEPRVELFHEPQNGAIYLSSAE